MSLNMSMSIECSNSLKKERNLRGSQKEGLEPLIKGPKPQISRKPPEEVIESLTFREEYSIRKNS